MTSPAASRNVENAPLLLVHVYPSVVHSTTSYFLMAILSYLIPMYSLLRSVIDRVCRDFLARTHPVDGPHGVKLLQNAYHTPADSTRGSSTPVASALQ